jgi:hypothetical protein
MKIRCMQFIQQFISAKLRRRVGKAVWQTSEIEAQLSSSPSTQCWLNPDILRSNQQQRRHFQRKENVKSMRCTCAVLQTAAPGKGSNWFASPASQNCTLSSSHSNVMMKIPPNFLVGEGKPMGSIKHRPHRKICLLNELVQKSRASASHSTRPHTTQ